MQMNNNEARKKDVAHTVSPELLHIMCIFIIIFVEPVHIIIALCCSMLCCSILSMAMNCQFDMPHSHLHNSKHGKEDGNRYCNI